MSKLVVIGLTGVARSGKSTTAQALSLLGGFHRVGLADGIRESLNALDGPEWDFRKETELSTRRSMQLFGTECREAINSPSLWIDLLLAKIRYASVYHSCPRYKFVISDIRYQYEIDRISEVVESWNGMYSTWRISRPGFEPESNHSSETGIYSLNPIEKHILNNESKSDLIYEVYKYLEYNDYLI
jgi:hypothetical protein